MKTKNISYIIPSKNEDGAEKFKNDSKLVIF
jgi:hypothetical protein